MLVAANVSDCNGASEPGRDADGGGPAEVEAHEVNFLDAELAEEPHHDLGVLLRVVVSRRVGRVAEPEEVRHEDA